MFEFHRTYSFFEPTFHYYVSVDTLLGHLRIGSVARLPGKRYWLISTRSWSGGKEYPNRFPTRHEAAVALQFINDGWTLDADNTWHEPPRSGVDRCPCGAKYWDGATCHSCGHPFDPSTREADQPELANA